MRMVRPSLLLLAACGGPEPLPSPGDARAVLQAAMHQLPFPEHGGCVRLATAGVAFERDREIPATTNRRWLERWRETLLGRSSRRPASWFSEGSARSGQKTRLSEREARALDAAAASILGKPSQPRLIDRLNPGDVPRPFTPEGAGGCRWGTSVSSPAFAGDFAFVEIGQTCGTLCGSGRRLAFRRQGRGWLLVASAPTWIS